MRSSLGFIAIDLDGTALVEKIDKNPLYGWRNTESHLRASLIEYMKWAQDVGYDIIILTARPGLVEPALKHLDLGTQPTQKIKKGFENEGINITQIVRSPAGLKGGMMAEILTQYQAEGCKNAVGILFDDQLKQVNDVKKQENPHLLAFDINSKEDLEKYAQIVSLPENHHFSPSRIISRSLEMNELTHLRTKIENLDNSKYAQTIQLLNNLVDDLSIRIEEAGLREYKPEIKWVNKIAKHMDLIISHLEHDSKISQEDIKKACKDIFGTSTIDKVKPNSKCDQLVKNMILEAKIYAIENNVESFHRFKQMLRGESRLNKEEVELGNIKTLPS